MAEATGDFVGNKIEEKITKAALKDYSAQIDETSSQLIEIQIEKYMSSKRQKQIIDEFSLL